MSEDNKNNLSNPTQSTGDKKPKAKTKISVFDFIVTFLSPLIIGKSLLVYFGSEYAAHPGEGYGYGVIFAICLTLGTLSRFLWKYRHYDDEENTRN